MPKGVAGSRAPKPIVARPHGSAPGERRGGRQSAISKPNVTAQLHGALSAAFLGLGREKILAMRPSEILRFAMHVAAYSGFGLAAASLAEKCAPYFDPRLTSATIEARVKKDPSEFTDEELFALVGTTASKLIEGEPIPPAQPPVEPLDS